MGVFWVHFAYVYIRWPCVCANIIPNLDLWLEHRQVEALWGPSVADKIIREQRRTEASHHTSQYAQIRISYDTKWVFVSTCLKCIKAYGQSTSLDFVWQKHFQNWCKLHFPTLSAAYARARALGAFAEFHI